MDDIDRDILRKIENDARISQKDLAEHVGLSANAVGERLRKLHDTGVIRGFRTEIVAEKLGLALHALIEVKMESSTSASEFEARVRKTHGVVRAMVTTGHYDWLLEVQVRDQHELQAVIEALRADGLARETYSRVVATDLRLPLTKTAR